MNRRASRQVLLSTVLAGVVTAMAVPAVSFDIPDTPEGTVRAVSEALADRHPEVLWQALPPTYQTDITEVTHAFARRMDPQVWEAAFGLGQRTSAMLRDKKNLILESSMLDAAGEEREQLEDGWDAMVALLDSFFSSDVARLETLKTIDWERYLATTGRDLMNLAAERSKASGEDTFDREFTQMLRKSEIEVLSREGDRATLRLTAPDEEPEEMQLTRVEGRWVPSEMADDWEENVAAAKQKLADMTDEEIQQGSMQAMMMIGMLDGALTELETVETAEQFEQAIQGLLGPFLGGLMGSGAIGDEPAVELPEDEGSSDI
jgi:hypothetical protein